MVSRSSDICGDEGDPEEGGLKGEGTNEWYGQCMIMLGSVRWGLVDQWGDGGTWVWAKGWRGGRGEECGTGYLMMYVGWVFMISSMAMKTT